MEEVAEVAEVAVAQRKLSGNLRNRTELSLTARSWSSPKTAESSTEMSPSKDTANQLFKDKRKLLSPRMERLKLNHKQEVTARLQPTKEESSGSQEDNLVSPQSSQVSQEPQEDPTRSSQSQECQDKVLFTTPLSLA